MQDSQQFMNCNIYVVELENKKSIIHPSTKTNHNDVLCECQIIYEWCRIHKPLSICESFYLDNDTPIIVDYFVKKYMLINGIENVRGGSYYQTVLSDIQKQILEHEFLIPSIIATNQLILKDYETNYAYRTDIDIVANIVNDKWNTQTSRLRELQSAPGNVIIDRTFIPQLNWLKNTMDLIMNNIGYNALYDIEVREIAKHDILPRYQKLIPCLKHLYKYARELRDNIEFEPTIYLENPELLFDTIICHSHANPLNVVTDAYKNAIVLHARFEYMMYLIINRCDEIAFDIENP